LDFERLTNLFKMPPERREFLRVVAVRGGLTVSVSYILASSISAWLMAGMSQSTLAAYDKRARVAKVATASLSSGHSENYRDIQNAIMDRNVFNSEGKFPEEKDPSKGSEEQKSTSEFNINAPCKKPTASIELLGTIVADKDGVSVATVMESGYPEADIYKEGDLIIGNDQVTVVKIERNKIILNNNGIKECLELASGPARPADESFHAGDNSGGDNQAANSNNAPPQPAGGDCSLDEKYVQDELGQGFGTIIQKARLVPNTTDNVMNGFKIFAIDRTSLLGKVGFQNGDIITQVNDVSLKQPEQGFALYQAFQEEREIRINVLRNGTTPMMITCRIK
jgi:type II secretion system protein C